MRDDPKGEWRRLIQQTRVKLTILYGRWTVVNSFGLTNSLPALRYVLEKAEELGNFLLDIAGSIQNGANISPAWYESVSGSLAQSVQEIEGLLCVIYLDQSLAIERAKDGNFSAQGFHFSERFMAFFQSYLRIIQLLENVSNRFYPSGKDEVLS